MRDGFNRLPSLPESYLPKRMQFNRVILLFLILVGFSFNTIEAQLDKSSMDDFVGKWKGTSLCQVKNSPCHDEIVVYYITKGKTSDSCSIRANKIVNDNEEEMGVLPCSYDEKTKELSSTAYNSNWTFSLAKGKLNGTLIVHGILYRIVELARVK